MKIVFLTNNIRRCGPINVIESLLYNLKGNELYIISLFGSRDDDKIIERYKKDGINVSRLNLTYKNIIFKGKKTLDKALKQINPDVVHSHGLIPDILSGLLKKYYRISTIHNNLYEDYPQHFSKFKAKFLIPLHIHYLKKLDKNICCSESIYNVLNKKIPNCYYIRNGINLINYTKEKKLEIRKQITKNLSIPNNSIIYVYSGTITQRKRVYDLILSFKKYYKDNEYLLILGDGPEFGKCKNICDEHILMLGHTTNVFDYYLASDIYISNSSSEGLSISILEALNCGNLLLLSDIPSHNECLNLSNKIYLGENFNYNNFREKADKVISNLYNDISDINDIISAETMANLYLKEYKKG